jgi:protein-histidine N-methyltransferase
MFSFNFYDAPQEEISEATTPEAGEITILKIKDLIAQLPDSLAFSIVAGLPRRDLWHVKMQLALSDNESNLLGDSDIVRGLYEGGLKTWECSVDLAQYLSQATFPEELSSLEVGCGSGLPTVAMFKMALQERRRWKFTLQDYNDIFGLVTVPNLFLTWYVMENKTEDTEFEVTESLKLRFLQALEDIGIEFEFIVGPWGDRLVVLVSYLLCSM